MDTFISWHYTRACPHGVPARPKPKLPAQEPQDTWEDAAHESRWRDALWLFLVEHRWDEPKLWPTVNLIAVASLPRDRGEVREATRQILDALADLTRERQVRRIRKHWLKPIIGQPPLVNMGKLLKLPTPNV